jgi:hypothetical protein
MDSSYAFCLAAVVSTPIPGYRVIVWTFVSSKRESRSSELPSCFWQFPTRSLKKLNARPLQIARVQFCGIVREASLNNPDCSLEL